MAKNTSRSVTYDAPLEKVLRVVTSEEFQLAQRRRDPAVVEAEYREIRRSEDELVFELHCVEYERGMTGLNRKKTVKSMARATWDLVGYEGRWSYTTELTNRFTLGGVDRLERDGDRTKATYELSVDIRIPLVGRKVEGLIAKEMEKGQRGHDDMVRDLCAKLTS